MLESVAGVGRQRADRGRERDGQGAGGQRASTSHSPRVEGPLVKINCAALPKDLIESELFGHVKGAFTGATTDKPGLLEEAHRGSLLLDEITEMPMDLQTKLLRVLEERTVRRLGGAKIVPVDFRLISSTNLDPEAAVREGRLRQDLYFRINTVTVSLPPLRERTRGHPAPREGLSRPLPRQARARRRGHRSGERIGASSPIAGPAMCASCSTRSSARCWWPAGGRSRSPICRRQLQHGARVRRTPRAPPPGSLEEIERVSIVKALETTGWNKQAAAAHPGPPPADALLEDAQARHSAAPLLERR